MRETMARYLGSKLAPATTAGVVAVSVGGPIVGGGPWGCEVGGGGGGGKVALSGSWVEALRLRVF